MGVQVLNGRPVPVPASPAASALASTAAPDGDEEDESPATLVFFCSLAGAVSVTVCIFSCC